MDTHIETVSQCQTYESIKWIHVNINGKQIFTTSSVLSDVWWVFQEKKIFLIGGCKKMQVHS